MNRPSVQPVAATQARLELAATLHRMAVRAQRADPHSPLAPLFADFSRKAKDPATPVDERLWCDLAILCRDGFTEATVELPVQRPPKTPQQPPKTPGRREPA